MRFLFTITLFLSLSACDKNNDDCTAATQTYTFHQNKSILITANDVTVVDGTKTVFSFEQTFEQCPGAAGAYVSRTLYFEPADPLATEFHYSGSAEIQSIKCVLSIYAPIESSLRKTIITEGSIHGNKVNANTWHIEGSVVAGTETISFNADFKKAN